MKQILRVVVWAVALPLVIASCRNDKPAEKDQSAGKEVSATPLPRPIRPLPDEAFRVQWDANTVPKLMKAGASRTVSVTFKNLSNVAWPDPKSTGNEPPRAGAVRLGYRWLPASAATAVTYSPSRADLEAPLQPGQSATLNLVVTAPPATGEYRLQFDLVQELVGWFEAKDAARLLIPVRVQ